MHTLSFLSSGHHSRHRPLVLVWSTLLFVFTLSACQNSPNDTPPSQNPIFAGDDQTVMLGESLELVGIIDENILPAGASTTTLWQATKTAGEVSFSAPNALRTAVGFTTAGEYTLRLSLGAAGESYHDDVEVRVLESGDDGDAPGDEPSPPGDNPGDEPVDEPVDEDIPPFSEVSWQRVTDAPLARTEAQGAVVGGELFVFGGYTSTDPFTNTTQAHAYNPKTQVWRQLDDLPVEITHAGHAQDERYIYLAGGYKKIPDTYKSEVAIRTVYRYDTVDNRWDTLPPLPEARGSGALVLVDNALHFFGGTDVNPNDTADRTDRGEHWRLELGSATWQPRAPLPTPRSHMGYALYNGFIYAIGGQLGYEEAIKTQALVHRYDPANDRWEARTPIPEVTSHVSSATLVMGDRIIIIGGERAWGDLLAEVRAYTPATDSWETLTPLPNKVLSGVGGLIDGKLYFTGGRSEAFATFEGTPKF